MSSYFNLPEIKDPYLKPQEVEEIFKPGIQVIWFRYEKYTNKPLEVEEHEARQVIGEIVEVKPESLLCSFRGIVQHEFSKKNGVSVEEQGYIKVLTPFQDPF